MLFQLKTFINAILFLQMFTLVNKEILAFNLNKNHLVISEKNISGNAISPEILSFNLNAEDTIVSGINNSKNLPTEEAFVIPKSLSEKVIDFQVNSGITYRSFRHFIKNDSKKIYFQAWLLEKELQKLAVKTDSLRKTYASASDEQKEAMSAYILKMERRIIDLNAEIPVLYQNARNEENQYWDSASENDITRFQEKVKLFNDSIEQANRKIKKELATRPVADTLYLEKEPIKTTASKPESGTDIVYKIQLMAYKGKIPDQANKLLKKLSAIRKVENYIDDKGVKVYTTGNLKIYNDALTLQSQVKQEGVKSPVIAAYLKGKRITVAEARKINNEL